MAYIRAWILWLLLSTSPAWADPPKIFTLHGASGILGHDSIENAPDTISHGDHIWKLEIDSLALTQNPPHPFRAGGTVSPAYYFADEYIAAGKAADVILVDCPFTLGVLGNWHDGVRAYNQAAADVCQTRIDAAIAAGGVYSGAIFYCCEGDTDNDTKVNDFQSLFLAVMERYRATSGISDLPIILTTIATCNRRPRVHALQSKMSSLTAGGLYHVTTANLPQIDACFHLTALGQEGVGRRMAAAMP